MQNLITALVLAILITAFALLNSEPVSISFFFKEFTGVPLSLVILVSVLFGVILAGALALIDRTKLKGQINDLMGKAKQPASEKPKEEKEKSIVEEVKEQEEKNA
ncbi:MAG: LapA family protein [Candidatus Margulisbacteria bacterium]|nr:LapA family protein [Candidatus Margulisiibacteriota bacterium]MBU1021910.1 LapA family protein [Candidatus Margulisiibacteriota bacterium]MBU1728548.1 LapA family protein [Candidatus Margulisiibacteriota bacterium]MBU1954695.1 LapA family protein [Candidatus Margulisiibacteriota bacterium]